VTRPASGGDCSSRVLDIFRRNLTIPQDLGNQPSPDRFAAVDWNNRTTSVRVLEEVMAAPDARDLKPESLEPLDQLGARDCRQPAHLLTATR
jgi:hypothetical protein